MKTKTLSERIEELRASDIFDLLVEMFQLIDELQGYEELNAISYDANARLSKENEALLAKNKELEEELQERKAYIDAWTKKAKELEEKLKNLADSAKIFNNISNNDMSKPEPKDEFKTWSEVDNLFKAWKVEKN